MRIEFGTVLGQQYLIRSVGQKSVPKPSVPLANGTAGQQVNPRQTRGCYRCIVGLVLGHGTAVLGQEEIQMQKRIPEGDYEFWIVKADVCRGMLDVTFQIVRDRRWLGRTITRSFAIEGEQVWHLRQMLEACGMKIIDGRMTISLHELIGQQCAGSVVHDCDDTVIYTFFPATKLTQKVEAWPQLTNISVMPRYVM